MQLTSFNNFPPWHNLMPSKPGWTIPPSIRTFVESTSTPTSSPLNLYSGRHLYICGKGLALEKIVSCFILGLSHSSSLVFLLNSSTTLIEAIEAMLPENTLKRVPSSMASPQRHELASDALDPKFTDREVLFSFLPSAW